MQESLAAVQTIIRKVLSEGGGPGNFWNTWVGRAIVNSECSALRELAEREIEQWRLQHSQRQQQRSSTNANNNSEEGGRWA